MSEDYDKLRRLLEQATDDEDAPADELDPEAASLREAWLGFGRLLDAAQPPAYDSPLRLGEWQQVSPLPLGEGQGVRAVLRRRRVHRWLVSTAALVAASLLIGIMVTWAPPTTDRAKSASPAAPQTTAINVPSATLVQQQRQAAKTAAEPQWDDSLDEQIAQIGEQVATARENQLSATDDFASMQYRIEQFRQEVQADSL
jgi:hypothetical protein